MIKFLIKRAEGNVYGLGLSDRNVQLLTQGHPIKIKLRAIGSASDDEVLLFHGTTEEEMRRTLAQFIGPDTVIHGNPQNDS